jgi:hypothetical protein
LLDKVLFGTLGCGVEGNVLPLFLFPVFPRPDFSGEMALEGYDGTDRGGIGTGFLKPGIDRPGIPLEEPPLLEVKLLIDLTGCSF